jgi:hypothetical protein
MAAAALRELASRRLHQQQERRLPIQAAAISTDLPLLTPGPRPPGAVSASMHAGESATFHHLRNFDISDDDQAPLKFVCFPAYLATD